MSLAHQLTTSLYFLVTLEEFHKIASSEELKIWVYSQRIWVYPWRISWKGDFSLLEIKASPPKKSIFLLQAPKEILHFDN